MEQLTLTVSDAIEVFNQTLDFAYPSIVIEGEVASFKVNQGKFVFFDIKDGTGSLGCFMMLFQMRLPLEDGMKVKIVATPKLTAWGKFSLTVREVTPVGDGSLKKAYKLLRAKLQNEGLFSEDRKRPLPVMPRNIAVISSVQAAGYADFIGGGNRKGNADVTVGPDGLFEVRDYFNWINDNNRRTSQCYRDCRNGPADQEKCDYNFGSGHRGCRRC